MSFSLRKILDDKFELKGEWWLPNNSDQKFFGVLKYEKGTETLEVQGLFDGIDLFSSEPFKSEIILGASPGLNGVTLVDCYLTSSVGELTIFTSHMIFTNCIFEQKNDIKFKTCFVHFRYLDQWIRMSGLNIQMSDKKSGLKIEFERPEKITAKISDELDIAIASGWRTSNIVDTFSDFTITQTKLLEIIPKNEIGFEELRDIITTLQRFLTFAIDEPTHHDQIICYLDSDKKLENEIGMFYDSITSSLVPEKSKLRDKQVIFFYGQIKDDFEKILQNWFRIATMYEPTIRLVSAIKHNPHMYLEEQFSYYAQALESYHLQNPDYDNKEMEQTEYDRRIQIICDSLIEDKTKDWVIKKIGGSHANNKSFLQRIIEIATKHPQSLKEQSSESIIQFAKKFRNMRNTLTHPNSKENSHATDLFTMKHHAKVLTESVYLSELGFDTKLINEIIQKRRKYFHLEF